MTPKCTGSTPKAVATGRKIGVVMTISGDMSMNVPRIRRTMLIISRITMGLLDTLCRISTSCVGTRR